MTVPIMMVMMMKIIITMTMILMKPMITVGMMIMMMTRNPGTVAPENGREEEREEEEDGGEDGCEAGAPALADPAGGLDEGGEGGNAQETVQRSLRNPCGFEST